MLSLCLLVYVLLLSSYIYEAAVVLLPLLASGSDHYMLINCKPVWRGFVVLFCLGIKEHGRVSNIGGLQSPDSRI